MTIHFDTVAAAESHLKANGWTRGFRQWRSRDMACRAAVHPVATASGAVAAYVTAWEV